jgi:hypothetical protein
MNGEQQIQALLGQWYDIVGRNGFRPRMGPMGPGMGQGGLPPMGLHPGMHRHWRRNQQSNQDGFNEGGGDQTYLLSYIQQLQQQIQQMQQMQMQQLQWLQQSQPPVPVPVPVPLAAPAGPPATSGWVGADFGPPGGPPLAFLFPPRAAVVDAPLPTRANRDILPMSTGVPILPTQSAQITGRPQTLVFKIGRFMISNAGTAGGAADWICNDIKIGNVSQFVQSGDVPGDLFSNNAIDTFVRFDPAQTAMDVVVVVTYIGLNESGCPFFGAMVGTAAV